MKPERRIGRPPLPAKAKRTESCGTRLTKLEKTKVKRDARRAGLKLSDYIRKLICEQ